MTDPIPSLPAAYKDRITIVHWLFDVEYYVHGQQYMHSHHLGFCPDYHIIQPDRIYCTSAKLIYVIAATYPLDLLALEEKRHLQSSIPLYSYIRHDYNDDLVPIEHLYGVWRAASHYLPHLAHGRHSDERLIVSSRLVIDRTAKTTRRT